MPALIAPVLLLAGLAAPVFADSPELGENIWKKCRACHDIGPDAIRKVGPPLNDLLGRVAGTFPDYIYSKAMIDAGEEGLVWTPETLDVFLERPKNLVQSTKMSFAGLRKQADRDNLIAFLAVYSSDDQTVRDKHLRSADPQLPAEVLAIEGDRDYGEYLAGTCVGCHQQSGEDKGIPSITGWPPDVFMTVMFSYRSKFRENQVMQQVAGSLNNEEIAALAAYFHELEAAD
ncbi:MAG: c-type cytochrome [Rhodobacteraceae bacterium]|nr:c-type cytochrome [Paracoccaceae bacterium]